MMSAFNHLNYATHWVKNLTKTQLLDLVAEIASIPKEHTTDFISICFVFSGHGGEEDVLCMQNGENVSLVDNIIKPLITSKRLLPLPKLFFIDACRGGEDTNAYSAKSKPGIAKPAAQKCRSLDGNYFLAYATISKKKSFMCEYDPGSVWMQELAKQLKENNDSIQNIVSMINRTIWSNYDDDSIDRSQQPQTTDTLNCGPLYLRKGKSQLILFVAWSHLRSKGKVCHYLP